MSEIEKYQPQINELDQWAERLFQSGNFTDTKSIAQAFVKIAAGAELGLNPFQSMSGVHLIQGKPVVGAGLLASLLDRDPAYDYAVQWEPDEATAEACVVTVLKHGKLRGTSRFSVEDAKQAGIYRDNWLKYPKAMMFARAMSQAVRWYAPGATGGSVYVEGEIQPEPPSRVTARVQRFNDPIETVEGEIVDESAPSADRPSSASSGASDVVPDPAQTGTPKLPAVGTQLAEMSKQARADLYRLLGIEGVVKVAEAKELLTEKARELGLPESDPPDARAIHIAMMAAGVASVSDAAVEAFDHDIKTGVFPEPGEQAAIYDEAAPV